MKVDDVVSKFDVIYCLVDISDILMQDIYHLIQGESEKMPVLLPD